MSRTASIVLGPAVFAAVAARSYALRTVAAGVMIGVGVLTVSSAAWRLTVPDVGFTYMLSMAGGLVAAGTGIALLYVQTAAPRDTSATCT